MARYDLHEETNPFLYQSNTSHRHFDSRPVYSAAGRSKPHYFCSSFVVKLLLVATLLTLLQFSRSQAAAAPEFISHSILAKSWELLELLLVGILVSYGLSGRRRGNQTQLGLGTNYSPDVSHNPSIFSFERETSGRGGDVGNESPVVGFVEPVFVVRPGGSDPADYTPLDLPVRSLKSRVVESDDEEEFGCGYGSDDIASASFSEEVEGEINVDQTSVASFSSGDSCGSGQVGYRYFSSCSSFPYLMPVLSTGEHSWRRPGNVEPAASGSRFYREEDTRVEDVPPGSPYVDLRSRSMRTAPEPEGGGFYSVGPAGDRHDEPTSFTANFPIEEVVGLRGSSWEERRFETISSSPRFSKARSLRMDCNVGVGVPPPSSFEGYNYFEAESEAEAKQTWASSSRFTWGSSPVRSPSSKGGLNGTVDSESENSWVQVPRMMETRTRPSPKSRRTRYMRTDYETTAAAGIDYSSSASSASKVYETDSSRVVLSDAFSGSSGSVMSDSQPTSRMQDEMEVELWKRNAMKMHSTATYELPSFSQWVPPEQCNAAVPSSNVFGLSSKTSFKPKENLLFDDHMQRGINQTCDNSTASSVTVTTSMASQPDSIERSSEFTVEVEEDDSSLKEEMERLSRMVKQLKKNNDISSGETEQEDLDRKKPTSESKTSSHDNSNSSVKSSGIALDDKDKLLPQKQVQAQHEGSLSTQKSGRKALARRTNSRKFGCASFLDRELWKSPAANESTKHTIVKSKSDTAADSEIHDQAMCGGWDCLKLDMKPPVIRNPPRGKSVGTSRSSGVGTVTGASSMDTDYDERRRNTDDDDVRVEVSASKEKTTTAGSSGIQQDVVVISIGLREKNTGTPNLKPKSSVMEEMPEKSSKGGMRSINGRSNVAEEANSNAEIDRKAGEFIAKFKEQIRLQKSATRREG